MPVLSDMKVIQGDATVKIGDAMPLWKKTFNTGGRRANGDAILMLMVKGLTDSPSNVSVHINGKEIGVIERYPDGDSKHWHTQIINVGGANLNDGDNSLEIYAVEASDRASGNIYDDFVIKDVVCFFQQAA